MVKLSEPLTAGDTLQVTEPADAEHVDIAGTDGARRADHLIALGHQLHAIGRPDEAVAMAQEAIAIYRRLAWIDPETFAPQLARALTEAGALMCEVSWRLALAPAEEAIGMYRQLTEADLHAFPDLASSLSNLVTYLAEMGSCPSGQSAGNERR